MDRFFLDVIQGDTATLDAQESHHCVKVLRKSKGDEITGLDGYGGVYEASVLEPDPKACIVQLNGSEQQDKGWHFDLDIAIAPTKNSNRFEWFVEKATEIGVDRITPVFCDHSERKKLRTDRLQRIVKSAVKQSEKAYLPDLATPSTLDAYWKEMASNQQPNEERLIALCENNHQRIPLQDARVTSGTNVSLLIGPEGGFSPAEEQAALNNEFRPVTLGKSRLRVETAGVAGCYGIHLIHQQQGNHG